MGLQQNISIRPYSSEVVGWGYLRTQKSLSLAKLEPKAVSKTCRAPRWKVFDKSSNIDSKDKHHV